MKKLLFITPRNPFSGRYSGDVIRANKFIHFLSKKYNLQVISLDKNNIKKKNKIIKYRGFKNSNFLSKIFNIIFSVLSLQPLQVGYFFSPSIKNYVKDNYQKYDFIFLQSIRTVQYVPNNIATRCILDMGDLTSINYRQTFKRLSFLNPLKIVYLIESILVKKYEKKCFNRFNKILLFSKKEINSVEKKFRKKLFQINFGIDKIKSLYKFNKKNNKIIFIGNIKYAPNREACLEFINKILPKILFKYPKVQFHIIGEISKIDKLFVMKKRNVKIFDQVDNLEPYLSKVICGLANLNISSGVQTKLLTYMSYGIPSVCSEQVSQNFDAIKKSKINFYKDDDEMVELIFKFMENKKFSVSSSRRALKTISFFKWNNIFLKLNKII